MHNFSPLFVRISLNRFSFVCLKECALFSFHKTFTKQKKKLFIHQDYKKKFYFLIYRYQKKRINYSKLVKKMSIVRVQPRQKRDLVQEAAAAAKSLQVEEIKSSQIEIISFRFI
jgi:hypothetical protein